VQLDKTRIVVRQRSLPDIFDLALGVIRWCGGPLAVALAVGILPMFALNAYLLSGLEEPDADLGFPLGYMILLVFLVLWEIPLATAPATLYLGQAMFDERPSAARIGGALLRSLPQLFLYQILIRAVLVWPVATWLWLFSQATYLNEVILLERNPLRHKATGRSWQKSPGRSSTSRRSRTLHSGVGADLLGRAMASAALGGLLSVSLWGSIWALQGLFLGRWQCENTLCTHYFHAALWLVAGFLCVVRFLSYLDVRIRREGWDVELVMRAESERLSGPEAGWQAK
jgi:hypothetical protein